MINMAYWRSRDPLMRITTVTEPVSTLSSRRFRCCGKTIIISFHWGTLPVFTYFACSTWSSGTHRATSAVVAFPASESSDASERFRDLPFCAVLVFPSVDEPDLCRSLGGSSPPPFNSTHWTRYVFLICEKTWTTSPAGLTCTIRIVPCALSSSLSSPFSGLERFCRFECE